MPQTVVGTQKKWPLLMEPMKPYQIPASRRRFDLGRATAQEPDLTHGGPAIFLEAGDIEPYSIKFKNEHIALVEQYTRAPLTESLAVGCFQAFEPNLYSLKMHGETRHFQDIFTFMREKPSEQAANVTSISPEEINPIIAVKWFLEFLAGHYSLQRLQPIKTKFSLEVSKIRAANPRAPELLLYEGMHEVLSLTDTSPEEHLLN